MTNLENISYKKLTGVALLLTLGLSIPTFSYLSTQRTDKQTSASTKSRQEEVALGNITSFDTTKAVTIADIPFWYGKAGDEVLVIGNQFGETEGEIFVGKTQVLPTLWTNNNIQFVLNENMKTGDLIIKRFDGQSVKWFGLLDIYSTETKEQVDIDNNFIIFSNFLSNSTIFITTDESLISQTKPTSVSSLQNNKYKVYSYTLNTQRFVVEFANLDRDLLHNIYITNNGIITPFKLGIKTIEQQIGDVDKLNNPNSFEIQ
jgi:hypothetical protein